MNRYFSTDLKDLMPDDEELTVVAVACFIAGVAFAVLLFVALAV